LPDFLRQPDFDTLIERMGRVVRISHAGVTVWRLRWQTEGSHFILPNTRGARPVAGNPTFIFLERSRPHAERREVGRITVTDSENIFSSHLSP
jgi:hypothetical protein